MKGCSASLGQNRLHVARSTTPDTLICDSASGQGHAWRQVAKEELSAHPNTVTSLLCHPEQDVRPLSFGREVSTSIKQRVKGDQLFPKVVWTDP